MTGDVGERSPGHARKTWVTVIDRSLSEFFRQPVVQEAKDADVFIFSGGLHHGAKHAVVATDGMITDGPYPESKELIGGGVVVDVPTWEAAQEWAAKVAVACRCAQDVREFFPFRRPDLEKSR
jgi:hypothetical protein